jgi:AcrR family transcriptional regulator
MYLRSECSLISVGAVNEPKRSRVAPLAPDERRAALVIATLPLLRECGLDVSTRQIAEAAGVAEGTIFRVFPDKGALISATLAHAFDPGALIEALASFTGDPDLRFKVKTIVRLVSRRFKDNLPLLMTLRSAGLTRETMFPDAREGLSRIVDTIAACLKIHEKQLRLPPRKVAWLLVSMIMAAQRNENLSTDDMVTVLLDGVLISDPMRENAC